MKKEDLQNLALNKLKSAQLLAEHKQWSDAYYLAGFVIELGLKACVAKQFSADTIPDKALVNKIYSHDFRVLVGLAGLGPKLKVRQEGDVQFEVHWAICSEWSPSSRYEDKCAAETTYLLVAISDKEHGVLPWIRKYW